MRARGGSFGLVALLIVLLVVLLLAARDTRRAAPALADPKAAPATAAEELGGLPGVDEMKAATGAHADRVQEALAGD
jgi:hypothetical protein